MPQIGVGWVLAFLLWGCLLERNSAVETDMKPYTKLDYRQSFKVPYFYGDNKSIPHFEYSGSSFLYCLLRTLHYFADNCHDLGVIPSQDYIRLTPSVQSSSGSIWSTQPNPYQNWEVEIWFSVSGRGKWGGEGFAFWYTKDHAREGPVLGNQDQWTGLAVIFDTYDNDNRVCFRLWTVLVLLIFRLAK